MPTLAGLLNQPTAEQALPRKAASPMANSISGSNGTNNTSESATNSATVSANDFLTLLVTEMKNQDPTANTDPNEYINQLVNVNSLEQLIGINQTLNAAFGSPASAPHNSGSPRVVTDASSTGDSATSATSARSSHAAPSITVPAAGSTLPASSTFGNLSAPQSDPAAMRVGHALTQPTRANAAGSIPFTNR